MVVFSIWFFSGTDNGLADIATTQVERQSIQQVISETGELKPRKEATLAFGVPGRVVSVSATSGVSVADEEEIASLDTQAARANLDQALANLAGERARLRELQAGSPEEQGRANRANIAAASTTLASAERNLQRVREEQNEAVRSAREDLYTSNLQAYLVDGGNKVDEDFTPPTVTGTYNGTTSGVYRLSFYESGSQSGWSFNISGLSGGNGAVLTTQPEPIGKGLYVEFPENFGSNAGVVWEIPVPNDRSAEYTTLKNNLEQAKRQRQSALETARNKVADARAALEQAKANADLSDITARASKITAQEAAVRSAQAQVQSRRANLQDHILKAPFAGTVADVSLAEGERVTAGSAAARLISDDAYEIEIQIPEVDTAELNEGDSANISFDAFPSHEYTGEISHVAPIAKTVEGVKTVEVTIKLGQLHNKLRPGLSADVDIIAATGDNLIAVPSRAVFKDNDGEYVYVMNDSQDSLSRRDIQTGLEGTGGYVQVRSGLSVGETVVAYLTQDQRDELQSNGLVE